MFDLTYFKKYLFKITTLVVIMTIIQFVLLEMGIKFLFIIPNMPLSIDVDYNYLYVWLGRPEACFTEPAHLAQFLVIPLILILCGKNNNTNRKRSEIKKNRIKMTLFTIGILFSMLITFSGNAVVLLLCILIAFLIDRMFIIKKYISSICLILLMSMLVVVIYNVVPQFQEVFGRVTEITEQKGSGYIRIFHGFDVFSQLPLSYKIFGVGYGNVRAFALYHSNIKFSKLSANHPLFEYLNGIQYVLLGGGILGLVLYLATLFRCINKSNTIGLYVIITFIVILFVSAFVAGGMWLIFMLLLLSVNQKKRARKPVSLDAPLRRGKICATTV